MALVKVEIDEKDTEVRMQIHAAVAIMYNGTCLMADLGGILGSAVHPSLNFQQSLLSRL